jgi:ubiquinone/menaquinone biosynthesis C-methylase UbiE
MEEAYLEYRKACSLLTLRNAEHAGLLGLLSRPKTVDELADEYGCAPGKVKALELILEDLRRLGAVEKTDQNLAHFVLSRGFAEDEAGLDRELMAEAVGEKNVAALVDGANYGAMADDLRHDENTVGASFDAANLSHWDDFLEMPFYKLHRDEAVRAIARPGGRCLDLGSGLGYGIRDLASRVGPDGLAVGLEISADFVAESLKRVGDNPQVVHVNCDLDRGFPFVSDAFFDGAMIIGAWHFLKNRSVFFSEVRRVLKVGGRLCIGHVYTERGSLDQEIMDLRFATRIPTGYPVTVEELETLARENGMIGPTNSRYTGCMGWFEFEAVDS